MTFRIIKRPQVDRDLIEHYTFIARDRLDHAERFLLVASEMLDRLAELPLFARLWESHDPRLAGIRVCPMPSPFQKYLIFYRPIDDRIEVFTVMHGTRDVEGPLVDLIEE